MNISNLEQYAKRRFSSAMRNGHTASHDVYTLGDDAPTIVLIQELPGIGQETLLLAQHFNRKGFRVVLPHLFGPLGRTALARNSLRAFCMRREFSLFEKNQSSPVVDWLKALCRDLRDNHGARGIGVIGMCLTGNFAISLMADDSVLAAVASQPSLPLRGQENIHMAASEVQEVRQRLDEHGPMMALRFQGDKLCTNAKFEALRSTFNDDKERIRLIELPGPGHSVLTLDLFTRGQPPQDALNEVVEYFQEKLTP